LFKKKLVIVSMILIMLFSLTACGEKLYELTPEEEGAIVSYSARTVAKYNNYQSDGLIYVSKDELEEETQEEEITAVEETEEIVVETPWKSDDEDGSEGSSTFGSDQSYEEKAEPKPESKPVTSDNEGVKADLSTALKLGNVKASYIGYEVSRDYVAENIFSMTADPGKVFFTVKIRLTNTGSEKANIDLLASRPSFGLLINGEREAVAMTTVLLDDLGTYQGSIAPNASVDTVVIFSVSEDIESRLNSVGLRVLYESVKSDVEF